MASSKSFDRIIAGTSSGTVHLYDTTAGLSKLKTPKCLDGLTGSVTGVKFGNSSAESVLVSTTESVLMVDLRTDEIVHTFSGKWMFYTTDVRCSWIILIILYCPDDRDGVRKKPFNCFDVNINDRIICAGTEQGDQEAYLLFFDVRKQTLLGAYWDRLMSYCFHLRIIFFILRNSKQIF